MYKYQDIPVISALIRLLPSKIGKKLLGRFIRDGKRCIAINNRTLKNILQRNKNTFFAKEHDIGTIDSKCVDTILKKYKERVPVQRYKDLEPYVKRMADGEKDVLCSNKVTSFSYTAGTTGVCKLIPVTKKHQSFVMKAIMFKSSRIIQLHFCSKMKKGISLVNYKGNITYTKAGIPVCIASASGVCRIQKMAHHFWTSPGIVFGINDSFTSSYLHLLYGLSCKSSQYIVAVFALQIVRWLDFMQSQWDNLVSDIEKGHLRKELKLSSQDRKMLKRGFKGNKKRADELKKIRESGFESIVQRIWPSIKYISIATGGVFASYIPFIKKYTGNLPIYDPIFSSSEVLMGISLNPSNRGIYHLTYKSAFFEFIPIDLVEEDRPVTLGIQDLEEGALYEPIVTNYAGLYRYRTGDIIQVVGWDNEIPLFRFSHRQGTVLNLVGEKISESHVLQAVKYFFKTWKPQKKHVEANYFGYHTDLKCDEKRYVFYFELANFITQKKSDLESAINVLDSGLKESNGLYKLFRENGSIEKCNIKWLKSGTRSLLHNLIEDLNPSGNTNQIKIPMSLIKSEHQNLIKSRILETL